MSQSRKKLPAPAVVSTGCGSGLMSCLSLRRRAPTPPMPRRRGDDDNAAAEQYYWERLHFLEEEIRRLGRTVMADQDDKTTAAAAVTGSSNGKAACRDQESTGTATATTTTKRCVSVGHGGAGGVQKMTKLEDGSYLHEICRRQLGRPWERLAVQVSQPVVSATAATASEVLDKLMAMGKAEDTCRFLAKTMPMKDIAGQRHKQNDATAGETVHRRTASVSSGSDFMEAVLFNAMDRMEGLILDGLKIQMSSATSTAPSNATAVDLRRNNEEHSMVVHVVLVQVRDPEEGYGAIGDPMIGLLEVSMEKKEGGRVKVEVQGLHVAGIVDAVGAASWSGSRCRSGLMWSASRVECDNGGGDSRRCSYVRNPNRVFQC